MAIDAGCLSSTKDDHVAECVGALTMGVGVAPPDPKTSQRWERRVEALTAWLLSEWRRVQEREAA